LKSHFITIFDFDFLNILTRDGIQNSIIFQVKHFIYRNGKGIHLLIIISGQGEKLETKLGMQGEMEK
jgi:hypothetical protein